MGKSGVHTTVATALFSNLVVITLLWPLLRGESLGLIAHLLPSLVTALVLGVFLRLIQPKKEN